MSKNTAKTAIQIVKGMAAAAEAAKCAGHHIRYLRERDLLPFVWVQGSMCFLPEHIDRIRELLVERWKRTTIGAIRRGRGRPSSWRPSK